MSDGPISNVTKEGFETVFVVLTLKLRCGLLAINGEQTYKQTTIIPKPKLFQKLEYSLPASCFRQDICYI